ncbi:MAG: FtsH protease activity modulator HflK [Clostridiales bacterium]|nr:FtsH protease activity modulator HflK [Clostridiales bacterium]
MTQTKKKGRWGLVLAALAIIAALVAGGLYRVGQGEQALVITFGKVTGTNGPGLYWHMPGVQQIIAESVTTIRDVEYGYRTSKTASRTSNAAYADVMEESVMLTNDNSIVQLEAIYQYTIRDVKQYVFDVVDPEKTMHLAFEAILRRNIQSRSLDEALLSKDLIEQEVLPDFQALIDSYEMGVKINGVHIQNITVPSAVIANYEDVNNAKNEKARRLDEAQTYENKVLPLTRSQAYQMTQSAQAYKASEVAKAEAEVALFRAVYERYQAQPDITRDRMIIETMESILGEAGKIVVVDQSNNVLSLLDLSEDQPEISVRQGGEQ